MNGILCMNLEYVLVREARIIAFTVNMGAASCDQVRLNVLPCIHNHEYLAFSSNVSIPQDP
jgi:hypothetical protein